VFNFQSISFDTPFPWNYYSKRFVGQALVAHACNHSYLGGKNQEDHGWIMVQGQLRQTVGQMLS
jgi:hypothetical protein